MRIAVSFFLVHIFVITGFAKSQTIDDDLQRQLNRLLLMTTENKANYGDSKSLTALADSINSTLDETSSNNITMELKALLSNTLLGMDKQVFYKPKRVEAYLSSISKDRKNDIYDYLLNKNYYLLRNDYGWNPTKGFGDFRTINDVMDAVNFKYYSEQSIDNDFSKEVFSELNRNSNTSSKIKENILIKLCTLIKYDSATIDFSIKKEAYSLLTKYIANENLNYLHLFNSFNNNSETVVPDTLKLKGFSYQQNRGTLWAGIEVGNSAVKLSLIQFMSNENEVITFRSVCEPKTLDIDSRSIDTKKIRDISKNVRKFYDCLYKDHPENFNYNPERIFIAYSSGFCTNLKNQQKENYLDTLDVKISEFLKAGTPMITHLTPEQESAFTFLGLVQTPALRDLSVVIDIGNGNTKGGFFSMKPGGKLTRNDFQPVNFDLASGSLKTIIDERIGSNADIKTFSSAVKDYMAINSQGQIADIIYNQNRGLTNKKFFYFAGGISWVISTLKDPNNATFRPVEINESDIVSFIKSVTDDYDNLLTKATNQYKEFLQLRKDNYNLITNNACIDCNGYDFIFEKFDQKLCIAGATVLLETLRSLKAYGRSDKRFFLATTGKLAWTNGYVVNSLE